MSAIDRSEAGSQLADEIYLGSSWVPAPGATAALARLVEGGFGAAVVSNTNHGEVAELLSRVAMCSVDGDHVRVAAIVDSHVIGVEKPEARALPSRPGCDGGESDDVRSRGRLPA